MSRERWYYFLSIEKDFMRTLDFAHLNSANFSTFSNEYAKLLLIIGSEVDVVAKLICDQVSSPTNVRNIDDYRRVITSAFQGMHTIEIDISRFQLRFSPWKSWNPNIAQSPIWWKAYNEVKHERDINFSKATQENAANALCRLLALLLYYFKDDGHLQPYPSLLEYGFPSYLVTESGKKPPGLR